jgi:hypothetical protein
MEWVEINDNYNYDIINIEQSNIISFNLNGNTIKPLHVDENKISVIKEDEITVEEILKIDNNSIKKYNPLEIIKLQLKIIDNIIKYYKLNRLLNVDFYILNLKWIYMTSEYLCLLIKQPIHKNKGLNLIRSSYKFCNKKADCSNQYGFLFDKRSKNCINDHFVHNKIVSDIDNLLFHLTKSCKINDSLEQDVRKGLETINYVLNHMSQELSSFMVYFGNNISKYSIKDFYRYHNKN